MTSIKIAGVPEHFNYPWHLAIDKGNFSANNINLQWTDVPEGTGRMCQMLRTGETDMAIILTEGILKDCIEGNPSKIVQEYIATPLIWGIHVAEKSHYKSILDLKNKKSAISRLGSGSHLMTFVHAGNQNWDTTDLKFEIVHTIDGAVQALTNGKADYFLWEKFTTQPLVNQGVFRRIGECPTPWPCFVIAVRNEILVEKPSIIQKILEIINKETQTLKSNPALPEAIANQYSLEIERVKAWLALTNWSQEQIEPQVLEKVQNQLFSLQLIKEKKQVFDFLI
jgi:ABC-type nitrate/sulfonate/bicarbonate transport system substrate-binding protein